MLKDLEEVFFPEDVEQALDKLEEYGDHAMVIAGGTDLVADPPPGVRCLIDINKLGLNRIVDRGDEVAIGATTTMQELALSPKAASLAHGMLSRSSCEGWPTPVRNAATLGGNLAGGGPFADTPAALLALDASVVIHDSHGERTLPLDQFFVDYRTTAIERGLLKEVVVPKTPPNGRGIFMKLAPGAVDQALVNVGVYVELEQGHCRTVRIALGAVTRTPTRIAAVEEILREEPLEEQRIKRAQEVLTESLEPILDMRAPADYRRKMSGVLLRRALTSLANAS